MTGAAAAAQPGAAAPGGRGGGRGGRGGAPRRRSRRARRVARPLRRLTRPGWRRRWPRRPRRHQPGDLQLGDEGSRRGAIRASTSSAPIRRTSRPPPSSSTRCATSASRCSRRRRRSPPTARPIPPGSFVVKTAQAGRAHVLDMFEPQDHPNDMDERGIPRRPYDNAGWTLAYQMGVKFDTVWDDVTGPSRTSKGSASPLPGKITGTAHRGLPAVAGGERLLHDRQPRAEGERRGLSARRAGDAPTARRIRPARSTSPRARRRRRSCRRARRSSASTSTRRPAVPTRPRSSWRRARIALWDTPTGSMPSGWTRFLLERFEFPFTVVCGAGFDDTALRSKYDVIVLPSGAAIPGRRRRRRRWWRWRRRC